MLPSCDGTDDESLLNRVSTPPSDPTNTTASNTNTGTDTSAAVAANQTTYADGIFVGINSRRNSNGGLTALIRDNNLNAIAAAHNIYMRNQAPANANPIRINHDNIQTRGNQAFALGYTRFGENVAGIRNYPAAQVVNTFVTGWINSPGHFQNIVGDFTHTGIDVLVDPRDGTIYATQVFAK